ncbi:DUF2971 domain-containing protein [Vibrio clamense]|uniref:DUF2971 domain-containing protein n=1 Tax=Vibrio clamense TaxID=2910254 RepID=UPI003D248533
MNKFYPLYKFREVNDYSINSIVENTIWFSHVDDFNDPFELYYKVTAGINSDNFTQSLGLYLSKREEEGNSLPIPKDMLLSIISESAPEQRRIIIDSIAAEILPLQMQKINEVRNDNKIFSLSFVNDHPLLWGHYANGLKGMCIEYDLNKQLEPLNIGYCPVRYDAKPYAINILEMLNNQKNISDYSEEIFATKNDVWKYEQEFRLVSKNSKMPGNQYQLGNDVIRSIIIGEKMLNKDILRVRKAIEGRNINLYKAIAIPEDFRIDIIDFEGF